VEESEQKKTKRAGRKVVRPISDIDNLVNSEVSVSNKRLPKLSSETVSKPKGTFFEKVQLARKNIVKSRDSKESIKVKKANPNKRQKKKSLDYNGEMVSAEYVVDEIIRSFGRYFKVWQRKALMELSLFGNVKLSPSVYESVPSIFSWKKIKSFQKGIIELIESCEKRAGYEILSFEEKAKILDSRFSYVAYTQIALNRLWYLQSRK
jgi:hypothetical protein